MIGFDWFGWFWFGKIWMTFVREVGDVKHSKIHESCQFGDGDYMNPI